MARRNKNITKDTSGVAFIEAALALPILLILLLPIVNYFSAILAIQKVNRSAATIADMVSMSVPVLATTKMADMNSSSMTTDNLNKILAQVDQLMLPLSFANGGGKVNIYSYYKGTGAGAAPALQWRATYQAGGKVAFDKVGSPKSPSGGKATPGSTEILQADFAKDMFENEGVIIVEVLYTYMPPMTLAANLGIPIMGQTELRAVRYYMCRNGALQYVAPDVPPPGWSPT